MNILEAIDDPKLFGAAIRDPASWAPWRAFLAVLFGLPVPEGSEALVAECTGSLGRPTRSYSEAWLVVGRRGGKSFTMALIAVFLACFRDYRPFLTLGERGTIMVIAADRRQARTILRYVRGLLDLPMLKRLVEREVAEGFDLTNRVTIEVATNSIRSVRGYTIVACLADEVAFWASEDSASPDTDVLDSIRPGMGTIPGAMMLCASSPYARKGALWEAHKRWFGKADAPVLVWQADTRTMNPSFPQAVVDNAMETDPASASAEYGAQFRSDVSTFLAREVVEATVDNGVFERLRAPQVKYVAFCDPSGGANDSMTLAVAHAEDRTAILDAVRERKPPFSPDDVVKEFAELLKSYGLNEVEGDRYAGMWPRERFLVHGITYKPSAKPKSDLYKEALPSFNGGRVRLLDVSRLTTQLCTLERRTARGGRDSIDHAPGAHDDVANAVCGALCGVIGTGKLEGSFAQVGHYSITCGMPGASRRNNYLARLEPPPWWIEQGKRNAANAARARFNAVNPGATDDDYATFVRQHDGMQHPMIPPHLWTRA